MDMQPKLPINKRMRLFQCFFVCRPTPKHPRFLISERANFFVWAFDLDIAAAASRAKTLLSAFPFEILGEGDYEEITQEEIDAGKFKADQIDLFVSAAHCGMQFIVFYYNHKELDVVQAS